MAVVDREGNVLEETRPAPREAIRADTAFVMTNLLRGVVQRGTAGAANALDWPLAGKTGTVDDYTDAWFVGFDPNITVGVWVGYDEKKPIGYGETGARHGAADLDRLHARRTSSCAAIARTRPTFEPPGNIIFLPVDRTHRRDRRRSGAGDQRSVHLRHAAGEAAAAVARRRPGGSQTQQSPLSSASSSLPSSPSLRVYSSSSASAVPSVPDAFCIR